MASEAPAPREITTIAIVGGGIAGCATAAALRARGLTPVLIERHDTLASEASGNPVGLLHPRLSVGRDPYAHFHEAAFLYALQKYDEMEATGKGIWHTPRGLVDLATSEDDAQRQRDTAERLGWPDDVLQTLNADAASSKLGIAVDHGALWFPGAGMVNPREICERLADGTDIIEAEASALTPTDSGWQVRGEGGKVVTEADAVVIAGGANSNRLLPETSRPPSALYRGQITYLDPASVPTAPRHALAFGHYLTPPIDSRLVLGATFDHWLEGDENWPTLWEEDHLRNIEKLGAIFGDASNITATGGRAGLRVAMPDHLPAVGPAYDYTQLEQEARKTRGKPGATAFSPASDIPGLYMLTGLGAQGFLSAPLAAEILADMITGCASSVETSVLDRLLPCRFAAKDLRRG